MMQSSDRSRRNVSEPDAQLRWCFLCWWCWVLAYLTVARYHVRGEQLVEAALYFMVIATAVVAPLLRRFATRATQKKRAPFVVPIRKDERAIEAAWKQNAVLLGYDMDEKPWIWPDEVRVMQGIVLGMTGSGKTTLLKSIITQDIARMLGRRNTATGFRLSFSTGRGTLSSLNSCCHTSTARGGCTSYAC